MFVFLVIGDGEDMEFSEVGLCFYGCMRLYA